MRQPVPKSYRKCYVKFQTTVTPSVQTGFPAVIHHSLSGHLKCLTWKPKTWDDLTSANLFFLERRMRSAANLVKQSSGYGYLSQIDFKNDTNGKWQPSEFELKFKFSEVGTLICGQKSVPVYNLLEHFLSKFQMWTFHFALNTPFLIGFGNGLARHQLHLHHT